MDILIGCDPEVFVKQNNIFTSAFGLIPGTKKNPFKVPFGAVQVDGMALEFNIDPAKTEQEFLTNVINVFQNLRKMVPQHELIVEPVAQFTPKYMKEQPTEAVELGCDPDFNGWNGNANDKPDGDRPFRTASGHIHIGWTKDQDVQSGDHYQKCCAVARQMDFYLGLPSLVYDKDTVRRELYGKAGCFRPKTYGAEYRTLSNVWLKSPELIKWVYRAAKTGMENLMSGNNLANKYGDIQEIINNSLWIDAKKILQAENIEVPNV